MSGIRALADPRTTAPAPRLKAENAATTGAAVCALIGDLDLHTRPIAETALDQALTGRPPVLCVDARDVHFCDSTGLGVLLRLRERCGRRPSTALALVSPSARLTRLLEVTDADTLFSIYPDCRSAVNGLRRSV